MNKAILLLFVVLSVACSTLYYNKNSGQRSINSVPSYSKIALSKNPFKLLSNRKFINSNSYERFNLINDKIKQSCAKEICGSVNKAFHQNRLSEIELMSARNKEDQEIFNSQSEILFDNKISQTLALDRKLKKILTSSKAYTIENEHLNTTFNLNLYISIMKSMHLQYTFSLLPVNYDTTMFIKYIQNTTNSKKRFRNVSIDSPVFNNASYFLSDEQRQQFANLLNENFLVDQVLATTRYIDISRVSELLKLTNIKTKKLRSLPQLINYARAKLTDTVNKISPLKTHLSQYIQYLNNIDLNSQVIEPEFIEKFLLIEIHTLFSNLTPKERNRLSFKLDLKELIYHMLNSEVYTDQINIINDPESLSKQKEYFLDNFSKTVLKSLNAVESSAKIKKFKDLLDELKQLTLEEIKFADPIQQSLFESEFSKLRIRIPDMRYEDVLKKLKFQLKQIVNLSNLKVGKLEHEDDYHSQLVIDILHHFTSGYIDDNQYTHLSDDEKGYALFSANFGGLISDFRQNGSGFLSDHLQTLNGFASLSWSTVRFPAYGLGVAAHEIGHYIDRILTLPQFLVTEVDENDNINVDYIDNKSYRSRRSCMKQWHKNSTGGFTKQYISEDIADYFAGKLLKKMKIKHPWIKNFACTLMQAYTDDSYTSIDTFNSVDPTTEHSKYFFRVLHLEQIMNDKIPNSCSIIIQENKLLQCKK